MNAYVVFSDLKGFSKLSEPEIRILYDEGLGQVFEKVSVIQRRAEVFNTWGDACFGIFEHGKDAVDFCLAYREAFRALRFDLLGIKPVVPRIAGHFGEFLVFEDRFLERRNAVGWIVNTAARIEPITKAGQIFVTRSFKDNVENLPVKVPDIRFEELGVLPLAKSFGEFELFKLTRLGEPKTILDRLSKKEISDILPEPPGLTGADITLVDFLKSTRNIDGFHNALKSQDFSDVSDEGKREVAKLCKERGEFVFGISLIEQIEQSKLPVDGFDLLPYRFNTEVAKLKANCLSRLGEYEEAASLVYGLWHMGERDSDTLSMLAAQYKRKALFTGGKVDPSKVNTELLLRARDLYLEAFRLNIGDYYPAINAAYLYKITKGIEEGKGAKLADFIISEWGGSNKNDWWLDSTLAECELIKLDYEEFFEQIKKAIGDHEPSEFERMSLKEQLKIFLAYFPNDRLAEFIDSI